MMPAFPDAAAGAAVAPGAVAAHDHVAPGDFVVVDADATASRLALSGEEAPIVIRRDARAVDEAVKQLRDTFDRTRNAFSDALEEAFGARIVGSLEIDSARFRTLLNNFQSANPLFPVNLALAQSWATGNAGGQTFDSLSAALRQTMENRLIGEFRPASTIFMVSTGPAERMRTWGEASRLARTVERASIASIEEAGLELRKRLDAHDRSASGFLSGLLHPNVVEDRHLTALLLGERLGDRAERRAYRAGELIAKQGTTINRWSALALEHLDRSGLAPGDRPPVPIAREPQAIPDASAPRPTGESQRRPPGWVVVGLVCGGLVVVAGILLVLRRRRRTSSRGADLAPARIEGADLKQALLPHLARELKERLVHVLFAQRHALLENEEAASKRVAEMEERLSRLQPAIAERIRSYEQRIQALEREIAEKDQETRDLIRAKLVLARKELDEEITRSRIRWN